MAKKIRIQAELDDSKLRQQLDDLGKEPEKITVNIDNGNIDGTTGKLRNLHATASNSNSIFGKLKRTIGNTFSSGKLAMTGYLMALNEINKAARNAKITINDMDESVTNLSIAMGKGRNEAYSYLGELNKQAKVLGATTKETADSADSWIRQGKSIAETEKLVRDSMVLSKLGKIESADASEYLTASLNGYKKSASEAIDIVDKLTAVDMESASDAGGLAVSLSKTASAANMAGVSFDRLVGMVATVKEVTQDSDESVGNMFKSIFSRMNQIKAGKFIDAETGEALNDVEKVLNKVGIAIRDANGEFISSEKIMDDVGSKWESFDSTTQRAVATAMAGTYQYNKLIALFENYSKALQYTEVAADSAGTAMQKFDDSYLGSLEAKQNTLQASFESMVMNTDFSEVYGGILDATTALINFINQTNALKGVVTGIAVTGMVKSFLAVKTGIGEAYIALNKFQNALDITKKVSISTSEYEKLLLLSNGLSASQMKLVLSTNSLTLAQKQELLMASGLSAEEAALQLETWGMTAANTGLTAATTTLGNAFKGLWATLAANPLIVVTAAVSAAVMAYQSYSQKLEETRRANIDNATAAAEQADGLRKQYDEYMRLASIQDRTTEQETEFKTAVDNIIASLGSKADALKDLTIGTDEYASALARATQEELQSQAVNATVGRKSAEEEFQGSFWDDWKGSKVSVDSNSKGKALSSEAQKAVSIVSDSLKEYETVNRTWKSISWDIGSDDPTEAFEYYNSLIEAREKLVLASKNDESLLDTEIYKDLNNAVNSMSDSMDVYIEKLYEEQKLSYMAQNGIPTTTEEYDAMEEAITGAAGSSETLQNKFQDLLMTDFSPLINGVEDVKEEVKDAAADSVDLTPSINMNGVIAGIEKEVKPVMDAIQSAWADAYDEEGVFKIDPSKALDAVNQVKNAIDSINNEEGLGIQIDTSSIEELANVLTDTSATEDEVRQAYANIADAVMNEFLPAMDGMDDAHIKVMQTFLEGLGIMNAEELIIQQLGYSYETYTAAKQVAAQAGIDLANATIEDVMKFAEESTAAEEDKIALLDYYQYKIIASGATIDTNPTIVQLLAEYEQLGINCEKLKEYLGLHGAGAGSKVDLKHKGFSSSTEGYDTDANTKPKLPETPKGIDDRRAKASKSASKAAKEEADIMAELNSEMDKLQSAYKSLCDIKDTYNKYGKITVDQYQELTNMGFNFLAQLVDENGQLGLNASAFERLATAKLQEMQIQMARNATDTINGLKSEAEAVEYLTYANENLRDAALGAAEAQLYAAQAAATGKRREAADLIVQGYEASKQLAGNVDFFFDPVALEKEEKEKSKEDKTDKLLEAYNKEKALLEHMLNMDQISKAQYYDKLMKLVHQYFDGDEEHQEQLWDAEESYHDYMESIKTIIDWIEIFLENLAKKANALIDKASKFITWSKKNAMINRAVKATDKQITGQTNAYAYYAEKARKVGLHNSYIDKIQNGTLTMEDMQNESLSGKIEKYQEWYDKMMACEDAISELYDQERDLIKQKLDNVVSYFNDISSYMSSIVSKADNFISLLNDMGKRSSLTDLLKQFAAVNEQISHF